jgi:hypothetical protein
LLRPWRATIEWSELVATCPETTTSPEAFLAARLRWQRRAALLFVLLAPIGLAVLYRVPPVENSWYPACFFHKWTGLHCPGCGSTRALHHLLHGDARQAVAYNVLGVLLLPVLSLWAVRHTAYLVRGGEPPRKYLSSRMIKALFWLVVAYWIARNLPFYPCNLLAPHKLEDRVVVQVQPTTE